MAKISGILTDGAGQIINDCTIELYAKKTTSKVLTQTQTFQVSENGKYSMNVLPCEYEVSLIINGFPKKRLGKINIYSDSVDGTLNDYLINPEESDLTPEFLKQIFDARNEAIKSAIDSYTSAKKSADSANHANTSETNAKSSADAAKVSAAEAATSSQLASKSAITATDAASVATTSSDTAKIYADNANNSAKEANQSAINSANSAKSANTSEVNAKSSAVAAKNSADNAKEWASTIDPQTIMRYCGDLDNIPPNHLGALAKGIYYQKHDAKALVELGYPIQEAGSLIILPTLTEGNQSCVQIYTLYKSGRQFIRNYRGSTEGGFWENWVEQITTNNISADIARALPATKSVVNGVPTYSVGDHVVFKDAIGEFRLMPFRAGELPFGWYFRNGDNYLLSSPQGRALNGLSANYKRDHQITIKEIDGQQYINVPSAFAPDGRGFFERPANGTTRQVGSAEDDAIRNLYGEIHHIFHWKDTVPNGVFRKFRNDDGSGLNNRNYPVTCHVSDSDYPEQSVLFNASWFVPTAHENRPLNIALTPTIYLGV
ncbi:hypothetical protein DKK70_10020 [Gilliamella apicola]|uniref:Lambda-like tail fibre protein N-terminal domain-containing protein n=1 Tax=Gilliamella apicola TaxID=1196095 RepID=A0A2V4EDA3_9GAMM|nr:prophage tail fiber N-terminal domain-containing protein [Gilliamella apicola]PXZ06307.1 hypothetical protein DKK70_10020 [Gilliamella apicola]